MGLVLGSKEVFILWPPTERRAPGTTERAVLLGAMAVANFVAPRRRSRDGQSACFGDGFDECRFARAILADEVRHGSLEG